MINSLWVALAAAVWAGGAAPVVPDALELLRASLEPPAVAYEGVIRFSAPASPLSVRVAYAPSGRYRRELVAEGAQPVHIQVTDGESEWIFDRRRGKVWKGEAADPYLKRLDPDAEADLLAANYDVDAADGGTVAGRPCWRLEVRDRAQALLARRLWVDRRHGLILKSESYRPDGSLLAAESFESLRIPARPDPAAFRFSAPPGLPVGRLREPDFLELEHAKKESGLTPRLPSWLPAGYLFESLDVADYHSRKIIHYRFTDGVNALSLFQFPARLRLEFGGKSREKIKLSSGKGYYSSAPEGNVLGWSVKGGRLVLVGPLTLERLKKIAESIP